MQILTMKYLLACVVLLGVVVSYTNSVEISEELLKKYDCKKIMGRIVKKILKSFASCIKIVKAANTKEEFEKKNSCVIKCAMDKLGVLSPAGLVTKDTLQRFIGGMVPEEINDFAYSLIEDCLKDKQDNDDPYCNTYGGLAQCIQSSMSDFAEKAKCQIGAFG